MLENIHELLSKPLKKFVDEGWNNYFTCNHDITLISSGLTCIKRTLGVSKVHLEVDVVARQFTEEFLGQPVDDSLSGLTATSAVLRLNTQYSVEHVACHIALVSAHTERHLILSTHNTRRFSDRSSSFFCRILPKIRVCQLTYFGLLALWQWQF